MLLCAAVYLPGISGPWIFDDYTNIIHNSYVRIASLDSASLYQAALSMDSGPLRRPISLVSFALNYYFGDGLKSATPYKITNLVIHLLNTLLVFWLAVLILIRVQAISKVRTKSRQRSADTVYVVAACVALVWSIHPLQLTSVLYIVQRMTELAATFTLLGLIFYLYGRKQFLAGRKIKGCWFLFIGLVGCGLLGVLSKENAALLPLFAATFEFFLFRDESPWRSWRTLTANQKLAVRVSAGLVILAALALALNYALPRYESREFTLFQRLATEARVIFFYISLLFVPDITRLGHQHDDIEISWSLFVPWTTLPSVLGVAALIVAGFWLRRRNPLLGFGIIWFFTGHLLESTVFPLEIAHEHRNYLPSFGFALGIASVLTPSGITAERRRLIWISLAAVVIAFAGATYVRAGQWSDHDTFYRHEVAHHPESPRIWVGYSVLLEAQGRYQEAQVAVRQAIALGPHEAGYLMDIMLLDARQKHQLNSADHADILQQLTERKVTATTILTLDRVDGCLQTWCNVLVPHMTQWIEAILNKPDAPDPNYFKYRLGRIKAVQHKYVEALNLFQEAHDADKEFLHPLFEQINIFISLGQIHNAENVLARLKDANTRGRYRRDQEISEVETEINRLKQTLVR